MVYEQSSINHAIFKHTTCISLIRGGLLWYLRILHILWGGKRVKKSIKYAIIGAVLGAVWGALSPLFLFLGFFLGLFSFHGYSEYGLLNTIVGYILFLLTIPFFVAGGVIRFLFSINTSVDVPAWVLAIILGSIFGFIFTTILISLKARIQNLKKR